MMVRGTRYLLGEEVRLFREITDSMRKVVEADDYQEFVPSALSDADLFIDKAGPEVLGQMYTFPDKKGRNLVLVPEVTAVVQGLYKGGWDKSMKKPVKLWYLARCYRYERPQAGRYREFWQFGVENLGGKTPKDEMIGLLVRCLEAVGVKYSSLNESVKRGLDYYVEDGFEAEVDSLGAQKQVAGGGRYDCGIGWAAGVDRLMLARS